AADWTLIEPYLRENEAQFGIKLDDLLTVDGEQCSPFEVYRKVKTGASLISTETENR
ncbi:MAG: hypothetical protein GYB66_10660, partial [Chloroflexi bacterium]|nr:hypothetical protein [Chloroflexota bacterium]